MMQIYFRKSLLAILLVATTLVAMAQQNNNPFELVLGTANISKDNLRKDCPHLARIVSKPDYSIADINAYISQDLKEWEKFTSLAEVKKLNVAWSTLGIQAPERKLGVMNSYWRWYKAANVSEATRQSLFPHFPLVNERNNNVEAEETLFGERFVSWQRLYPEEFERFLNAPELVALNPYYNGYYKLPYLPRFIGAEITYDKPKKVSSGNAPLDEYTYQLQLRNWYFVLQPAEFEKLYGKDYKFPETFDAQKYREEVQTRLQQMKEGKYPNYGNGH